LAPFVIDPVETEPMKLMAAILEDPNPIHIDPAVTQALGLGDRLVNQGTTNVTWLLEAVQRFAGGADRIRAFRIRFIANVFAGERFEVTGKVTAVDAASGEADLDLLATSGGRPVLGGTARITFENLG
jgi:acyl dehydratase